MAERVTVTIERVPVPGSADARFTSQTVRIEATEQFSTSGQDDSVADFVRRIADLICPPRLS